MRVLLVESNPQQAAAISADLKVEAIAVDIADSGDAALYVMRDYEFDLVMLSSVLSDMDGSTLIARIRQAKHATPVIALSAIPRARLKALAAGADDVVERDVDRAELGARIRAIVRRSRGYTHSHMQAAGITLDADQREVVANGVRVHLTGKEFAFVELLMLRRNMIMTKEAILAQLYGGMDEPEIKIVDVFVCKIRRKLIKAGLPSIISTVWGRGYSITDNGPDAPTMHPHPQRRTTPQDVFA